VAVSFDAFDKSLDTGVGRIVRDLCIDVGSSSSWPDKLIVKGVHVDLLFARYQRPLVGQAWTGFVLDHDSQQPTLDCVRGRNLQGGNRINLTQVLPFFVA
jgi:hypothetical protein